MAAIGAIQSEFPQASIKGCFYHLAQNIYRRVQSEGLQERYANDANFALDVRWVT